MSPANFRLITASVSCTGSDAADPLHSGDFPTTPGAYQPSNKAYPNATNALVTELTVSGTALAFSTYLGGTGRDEAVGIAVDQTGNVYVTGGTTSTDFPTSADALQPGLASTGGNAFLTELNVLGSSLHYSSYFGGTTLDGASGIAVDNSGDVYLTGSTYSTDLPTVNAYQAALQGGQNAFVAWFVLGQ